MKLGEGLAIQAMTRALKNLFATHPNVTVEHVLLALEKLRYTVTEEAIARAYPELRYGHPADKKVPNGLRHKQKRPPEEDLNRTI